MRQGSSPRACGRPEPGGLHHIALGAGDVEAVAAFYRDVLGLPEVARHRGAGGALRSIWLDLRPAILMIEKSADPPRSAGIAGRGPFLIALAAPEAGREATEARLVAEGVTIESRTQWTIYFRDPEGNRVAVSDYDVLQRRLSDK